VVLAVVVENAGFGSQAAAPIARRVFDYLLLGHYPSEEDMALTREGKSGAPVGTPRRARDVPLPGQPGRGGIGSPQCRGQPVNAVFERPSIWFHVCARCSPASTARWPAVLLLAAMGLVAMYSAGYDHGTRFVDHGRNMLLALAVLFVVAQVPPQKLQQLAVPLYVMGVALLVATALPGGITRKGATRWLASAP
jgi:hypothetical protein